MSEKCLRIWRFEDAPEEYRKLSKFKGTETLLMFVPAGFPRMTFVHGLVDDMEFTPTGISHWFHLGDKSKVVIGTTGMEVICSGN